MDSIYFEDPLGLTIELASYRFEPPHRLHARRRAARGAQAPRRARRSQHRRDPPRRRDRGARPAITRVALGRPIAQGSLPRHREDRMAAITLNVLKPSVNNLTVRIFVRAAGLDFEEVDVWGKTTTPEFLAKDPAHLTPMLEEEGLPRGIALGELRDHAVPLQQARPRPVLSDRSGRAGDGRQRDVLRDRHALSADHARHVPGARLPAVPGRGRLVGRRRRREGGRAAGRRGGARRAARRRTARSSWTASRSSAATRPRSPTCAWRRRSSS